MSEPTFKDYFSDASASYAAFRPKYPAVLFDFVTSLAPNHRVAWDCATGSGQAAVPLADRFDHVMATDASAEQIAHATPHPRVTYGVALSEVSGIESTSVDLVTVAQALHWLPHARFFDEVRRVLVPGGALAVWCYARPRLPGVLGDIVHRFYYGECWPHWSHERTLVDEGYRSIDIPIHEVAAPSLRIEGMLTLPQFAGYMRTWSAAKKLAKAVGHDPVVAVEEELRKHWGGADARQSVTWPIYIRAGHMRPAIDHD